MSVHASQSSKSTINVKVPSEHAIQPVRPPLFDLPQPGSLSEKDVSQILAVRIIERTWCSYRDRQMFRLLKHAICAAEHSLSHEILRKVSPIEAQLLKDPSISVRIRFRFGGSEFPPFILFKIYIHTGGHGVKYMSGKKWIKPASEAAGDACKLMGNRNFYDQMITDTCQYEAKKITDEVDVTTMKDYMQYLSHLDETPAMQGGKENKWRRLDLTDLPRTTILYDIMDYVKFGGSPSERLRDEIPILVARPITQEMQLAHIRAVSQIRTPPTPPAPTPKSRAASRQSNMGHTARRSRQAKQRADKMRRTYTTPMNTSRLADGDIQKSYRRENTMPGRALKDEIPEDDGDDWEKEADKLYTWTQGLSMDDLGLYSPC